MRICPKCNNSVDDSSNFCPTCGQKMVVEKSTGKRKFPKWLLLGIIAVVAVTIGVIVFLSLNSAKKQEYDDQLDLGKKYVSELKYEQAILAYEEAIKINPKNVDAYLKLADAYTEMEDFDKAEKVLRDALDEVSDSEEAERLMRRIRLVDDDKAKHDEAVAEREKNDRIHTAYRTAIDEYEDTKKNCIVDDYKDDIKKLDEEVAGFAGSDSINYEQMSTATEEIKTLVHNVKSYNERYAEAFKANTQAIFEDLSMVPVAYEEEYLNLKIECEDVIEKSNYQEMPGLSEELTTFYENVKEINQAVLEFTENVNALDANMSLLVLDDTSTKQQKKIVKKINTALENNSIDDFDGLVEEYKEIVDTSTTRSHEMVIELCTNIDEISNFYNVSSAEFYSLCDAGSTAFYSGKDLEAYDIYTKAYEIAQLEYANYRYDLQVSQYDLTDYPTVNMYISIKDFITGEYLDDLDASGFTLKEKVAGKKKYKDIDLIKAVRLDGNAKINIAIVADCSASMDTSFNYAKVAMKNFVDALQTKIGDQAAVYAFSDFVERAHHFSSNKSSLKNSITNLSMGNMTALYDALAFSLSEIVLQGGAKCVIAFTDGQENYSYSSKAYVIQKAKEYNIPIYLIGIGSGVNGYDLEDIARQTGGFYENIYNVSDMEEVYNRIYKEQKSMYLMQYITSNDADDLARELKIGYSGSGMKLKKEAEFTPDDYKISGFVFHDSNSRYLNEYELDNLTAAEIRIAINEIYARCGYKFNLKQDMIEHFESLPWYNGHETDMKKVEKSFNKYEKANVSLLVSYECKHGLNGRLDTKY